MAPYAEEFLQYDAEAHVTQLVTLGAGCSVCSAGLGTYSYSYASSGNAQAYNNWATETTETLPNGTENIYYSNYVGETLLQVEISGSQQWLTYYQYDDSGRLIEQANPSAVTGYNASDANLGVTLNSSSGLIDITGYYTSTTASTIDTATSTSTSGATAGGVLGMVAYTAVQDGSSGTPILQSFMTYFLVESSSAGAPITEQATSSVYTGTNDVSDVSDAASATSGIETTSDAYTFYANSLQVEQNTTSLPAVTDQNTGHTSVTDTTATVYHDQIRQYDLAERRQRLDQLHAI